MKIAFLKYAGILTACALLAGEARSQETSKKVVILPSPDTTILEIKTNTTVSAATTTTSYTTTVIPTVKQPVDPPGTTPRANLVLDWNPTSPLKSFTLENHQYCCSYSITEVPSPDGNDGKVIKYDLRSTDPIVSSSKRAEVQTKTNSAQESEAWYGFQFWLEKYDTDAGAESIWQFHDQDGTTPPLSIQIQNGRMRIMRSFTSGNLPVDIGPVVTGQWVSFVFHVKWTTSENGLVEYWVNGAKQKNIVGRTNSAGGSYEKDGINKWSWAPGGGSSTATQRIYYLGNYRQGNSKATYKDVAPN